MFDEIFAIIVSVIAAILLYPLVFAGMIPVYLYYFFFDEKISFKALLDDEKFKECAIVGFCIFTIIFFAITYKYNLESISALN